MKKTRAFMVLGTSSFAGKSLIAAAFCRIFRDIGLRVAPFKAQNMSLNSAVTSDGLEISRAQAMQALAAGVEPTADMNPILLKPKGGGVSQVVLNGRPFRDVSAEEYYNSFVESVGRSAVGAALNRLSKEYELIVMEGAGSPAEINLYDRDIANFGAADMADADVVLVADIERGGVFASIYGTLNLISSEHRKRVKGIIINKFRGNEKLLMPAVEKIQSLVKVPIIGIVPYMENLRLPQEDSQSLSEGAGGKVTIAVIKLPMISNYTDFDPLAFDGRVNLRYVSSPDEMGKPDAIIVPGTKSTIDALEWLHEKGFDSIKEFTGEIPIIGICGGFQLLGKRVIDNCVERDSASVYEGLGLLDVETSFDSYQKVTEQVLGVVEADQGVFKGISGVKFSGYEIHMGDTKLLNGAQPVFSIDGRKEGAADKDFMTFGTYIHGLFDSKEFREAFINFIRENASHKKSEPNVDVGVTWEESLVEIAKTLREHVDISWFYE